VLGTKTLNDIVDPDGEYTVRARLVVLYVWSGRGFHLTCFVPDISITLRITYFSNATLHIHEFHTLSSSPNIILVIHVKPMGYMKTKFESGGNARHRRRW
jgi:hypothetical protein